MLVVFATNLMIAAEASGTTLLFTDPVPVGDSNRATGQTTVSKIVNSAAAGLSWQMQTSLNGRDWTGQGPSSTPLTTADTTVQGPTTISGPYVRLAITFVASAAGMGFAIFSVNVNLDRA